MRCHCHLNFRMQCHDCFSDCPRWYHLSSTLLRKRRMLDHCVAYISINHYYGCLSQRKRTSLCALRSDLKMMKNSLDFCFDSLFFFFKRSSAKAKATCNFAWKDWISIAIEWRVVESRSTSYSSRDFLITLRWKREAFMEMLNAFGKLFARKEKLDERKCIIIYCGGFYCDSH